MCTYEVQGCETNCNGDSNCQSACAANKPCGASDPTRVNVTSTSTTSSKKTGTATSTSGGTTVDENGFAVTGTPPPSTTGNANGAARIIEVGSVYGMGLLVAGMAVGVAMVGL